MFHYLIPCRSPAGGDESEEGDAWIYTAVKRDSYLFPTFSIGKWTQNTCRLMIYDFRRRARPFREERIEVFTDGNDDYTYVLKSFFPMVNINGTFCHVVQSLTGSSLYTEQSSQEEISMVYIHKPI